MKALCPILALVCLMISACENKAVRMSVEETRKETSKDRSPKLFATSDERFRNAKPSPLKGNPPENWLVLPAREFRELNYRFGESGEAYVTLASGSVADNVNRWLRQFGRDPLTPAEMDVLAKTPIAGTEGVWVEATGSYASGMGAPAKAGQALAGVIAEVGGRILTLKMVGAEDEVAAEREALRAFAASLELAR
ncbi:hypothetical protein HZ994_05710 [Akkermansiaceae bacterium]|nr:hypothetical protein HZ994_05710 [Akkermansiaceae bacterium]